MIRPSILVAVLTIASVGCDRWNQYNYAGVLISKQTGAPLANTPISVSPFDQPKAVDDVLPEYFDAIATISDASGRYGGTVLGSMCSPVFPPPAPARPKACVRVKTASGWKSLVIPLTPEEQSRTDAGQRWIDMPTIQVDSDGTPTVAPVVPH